MLVGMHWIGILTATNHRWAPFVGSDSDPPLYPKLATCTVYPLLYRFLELCWKFECERYHNGSEQNKSQKVWMHENKFSLRWNSVCDIPSLFGRPSFFAMRCGRGGPLRLVFRTVEKVCIISLTFVLSIHEWKTKTENHLSIPAWRDRCGVHHPPLRFRRLLLVFILSLLSFLGFLTRKIILDHRLAAKLQHTELHISCLATCRFG